MRWEDVKSVADAVVISMTAEKPFLGRGNE